MQNTLAWKLEENRGEKLTRSIIASTAKPLIVSLLLLYINN